MNLDNLRLFTRTAQLGGLSAAARDLSLSPATASARLAALEKDLGVRLMNRTTRATTLTAEGLTLLPHALALLEGMDAARAAVGGSGERGAVTGRLRVAAPSSFARMHLLPDLWRFLQRHPGLELDLRLSDGVEDLVEGAFDCAVRNARLTDSSFVARRLARDRRLLVAAPLYLERHGAPLLPADLIRHRCIAVGGHDQWTFGDRDARETVRIAPALRINDGGAARDAAIAGEGVALMSTWCAGKALASGALRPVVTDPPLHSEHAIWAIYPSQRLLAPKVRAFIDWCVETVGHEPWDAERDVSTAT